MRVAPLLLAASHKYILIQNGKTWSDAQAYCQATYIDLAIIESDEDVVQIQNTAQRQQVSSSAWIGLYNDIKSWRWSFGNESLGNMKKWDISQPNNVYGNQECGAMSPKGWDDRHCAEGYPFVCFHGESRRTVGCMHVLRLSLNYLKVFVRKA
ncbi:putative C-type lectin domain family 20 member A isoform X1 [Clarias magur]|uniref:Putative C-type lectin domain family 20 member A isoform X1 n=1 Tax=Clarias magur TaxID=1594786 RepID=A0A8J4UC39_CLAMG|nr:putative C-type lectin domain family 20 member A isoform X1 [Clarias magur]